MWTAAAWSFEAGDRAARPPSSSWAGRSNEPMAGWLEFTRASQWPSRWLQHLTLNSTLPIAKHGIHVPISSLCRLATRTVLALAVLRNLCRCQGSGFPPTKLVNHWVQQTILKQAKKHSESSFDPKRDLSLYWRISSSLQPPSKQLYKQEWHSRG